MMMSNIMSVMRYRFANLAANQLLPYLQRLLPDARLCWLQGAPHPVIGLYPRTTWTLYPQQPDTTQMSSVTTYQLVQQTRHVEHSIPNMVTVATEPSSYEALCEQLVIYMRQWQDATTNSPNHPASQSCQTSLSDSVSAAAYHHGLMGFISYDVAAQSVCPQQRITHADQPCVYFGHYDCYLTYSNDNWLLNIEDRHEAHPITTALTAWVLQLLENLDKQLNTPSTKTDSRYNILPLSYPSLSLTPVWHRSAYRHAFKQIQDYLHAGDAYQVNLTQPWFGHLYNLKAPSDSPHATDMLANVMKYLPHLGKVANAPFAGTLALPDFALISGSPELFFQFGRMGQDNVVITKPIKGTRPRGTTPIQDQQLAQTLQDSDKDRAENVMIVDLLRNDLSRHARAGSVQVDKLFALETFHNVHHLVSQIRATLADEVHPLEALFASLPAGSITGAPKRRAIEIIHELETIALQPNLDNSDSSLTGCRGAYCGSLGFINFDLTGQWNVLIRTLQVNASGAASVWAGGGITVASTEADEYQECWDKITALLDVFNHSKSPSSPD